MTKLTLSSIPSGYATAAAHNADNTAIEAAIENTLSRDGTGPNQMNANLDMNGYAILNQLATTAGDTNFYWAGTWVTGTVYSANNLVYAPEGSNLGNTLICISAHKAGATLDGDAAKWAVFAQRGAPGASGGDVVGPASATANSLARFNGTTGKLLKDGAVIGTDVQAYNANLAALTAFITDTDGTLAANSDVKLATQKATKTYADNLISAATIATPDTTADYFLFEDATDASQKKALLSTISPFTTSYTSGSPTTLSTNLILAENHSLGSKPLLTQAYLRCITTDAGYAVGDEIWIGSQDAPGVNTTALWSNSTQIGININGSTRVAHKSTNATTTLTVANWVVVLKAWL